MKSEEVFVWVYPEHGYFGYLGPRGGALEEGADYGMGPYSQQEAEEFAEFWNGDREN